MNASKILNVLLIIAVLIMGGILVTKGEKSTTGENGTEVNMNPVLETIHQRTSIRNYTKRKVSKEDLETLVKAGMAAPSAMNKQPWQFIIIDDEELLHALGENLQTSKMVQQAAAAILVCGNLQKAGEGWLEQYWIQDCSAASQNILLAITSLGLGGVWTSIYPAENRIAHVAGILDLPEHIIPLNIIPVGYPSQKDQPKNKWKSANLHWNKWK